MSIGEVIFLTVVFVITFGFIAGILEVAAEDDRRRKEIEEAHKWQMKGTDK